MHLKLLASFVVPSQMHVASSPEESEIIIYVLGPEGMREGKILGVGYARIEGVSLQTLITHAVEEAGGLWNIMISRWEWCEHIAGPINSDSQNPGIIPNSHVGANSIDAQVLVADRVASFSKYIVVKTIH